MSLPGEHERANAQKWDQRSDSYEDRRFDYFRWMQKRVLALIPFEKGGSFLDLGCGTGWAVRYVADLLDGEGQFIGVDISRGMLQRATENAAGLRNVSFCNALAEQLPIKNDAVDNILCTNSFHHYLHPERALAESSRVLKGHGRIWILDVSSDDFLSNGYDRWIAAREKEHVRFHSTREMAWLFSTAGLKYVQSRRIWYPLKAHIAEK
ncbi:MAG TPA: methyltransferase domain-containing protein [Anaerolineales bacterium]|nr:methyltransferase domain-containing protein [Anaerolineales bacterium]